MKLKKRTKRTRIRGARTCGWGFRQRHRGHGSKGGSGMAGTGKRADHKKQFARDVAKKAGFKDYFGKKGFTSRSTEKKRNKEINLDDIKNNFLKTEKDKIELKDYKILGRGEGFRAEIIAKQASKSAIEKMEKAGGKIFTLGNKDNKNQKKEQITKVKNFRKIILPEEKKSKVKDKKADKKSKTSPQ